MGNLAPSNPGAGATDLGVTGARPMVKRPKCGTEVRDIARFCTRCHATLRFQCPCCGHERLEQRSTLMKNILWVPFTLGIPLIRSLLISCDRDKS